MYLSVRCIVHKKSYNNQKRPKWCRSLRTCSVLFAVCLYFFTHTHVFSGYLHATFSSYVMPFCFAGVMYLLSGIFCLVVQITDHEQNRPEVEIIVAGEKDQSEWSKTWLWCKLYHVCLCIVKKWTRKNMKAWRRVEVLWNSKSSVWYSDDIRLFVRISSQVTAFSKPQDMFIHMIEENENIVFDMQELSVKAPKNKTVIW